MSGKPQCIVVDTNIIISRLLLPDSTPARALTHALAIGKLIVTDETMEELADVLAGPRWDPYLSLDERKQFLQLLGRIAELVPIVRPMRACRDPRDDKFLSAALNGGANYIVSGDRDLLALHPFHAVAILSPAAFLKSAAVAGGGG